MKFCKRQYRIVKDQYLGLEVQKRLWYFPFWFEILDENGRECNTHKTIEDAELLIEMDRTNTRLNSKTKPKVVKTYDCE